MSGINFMGTAGPGENAELLSKLLSKTSISLQLPWGEVGNDKADDSPSTVQVENTSANAAVSAGHATETTQSLENGTHEAGSTISHPPSTHATIPSPGLPLATPPLNFTYPPPSLHSLQPPVTHSPLLSPQHTDRAMQSVVRPSLHHYVMDPSHMHPPLQGPMHPPMPSPMHTPMPSPMHQPLPSPMHQPPPNAGSQTFHPSVHPYQSQLAQASSATAIQINMVCNTTPQADHPPHTHNGSRMLYNLPAQPAPLIRPAGWNPRAESWRANSIPYQNLSPNSPGFHAMLPSPMPQHSRMEYYGKAACNQKQKRRGGSKSKSYDNFEWKALSCSIPVVAPVYNDCVMTRQIVLLQTFVPHNYPLMNHTKGNGFGSHPQNVRNALALPGLPHRDFQKKGKNLSLTPVVPLQTLAVLSQYESSSNWPGVVDVLRFDQTLEFCFINSTLQVILVSICPKFVKEFPVNLVTRSPIATTMIGYSRHPCVQSLTGELESIFELVRLNPSPYPCKCDSLTSGLIRLLTQELEVIHPTEETKTISRLFVGLFRVSELDSKNELDPATPLVAIPVYTNSPEHSSYLIPCPTTPFCIVDMRRFVNRGRKSNLISVEEALKECMFEGRVRKGLSEEEITLGQQKSIEQSPLILMVAVDDRHNLKIGEYLHLTNEMLSRAAREHMSADAKSYQLHAVVYKVCSDRSGGKTYGSDVYNAEHNQWYRYINGQCFDVTFNAVSSDIRKRNHSAVRLYYRRQFMVAHCLHSVPCA